MLGFDLQKDLKICTKIVLRSIASLSEVSICDSLSYNYRNRNYVLHSLCLSFGLCILRWGVSHTGSSPVVSILYVHWCEVHADETLP